VVLGFFSFINSPKSSLEDAIPKQLCDEYIKALHSNYRIKN